ncbi:PREDICTED: tripartite motif-containing protein 7-like [Gekko japonicus]|uniref:Tripartite motif-containing protein 7-like n=1 Tax=Gekko japonicus TaxID=146911 RepID=A0ABM1L6D5_GEKJA|nr:PREDICTED: tripartite motif-containing protein 7-like [Gekko japonicus]
MAAGGPVQEASCSICLEFFRDPVRITECGHTFCRACLTRSWGEPGASSEPFCPQCRGTAQPKSLRPNQQLANTAKIIQKRRPLEGEGAEAKRGEGKGGVCEKHGEPLKFFCREDKAPLCVVCSKSQEHRDHRVTPLEGKEAAGEKKDRLCNCVESLRMEWNKILMYKDSVVKESQDLLRQTKGERQKILIKFRQLQKFLEEQEKLLLAQMEEVEKEVAKKRDQHLAKLSKELSSLPSLILEIEGKCQQPASDLLKDVRSTLQRYEEKEAFENPAAFPLALKWRIWDFSDVSPLLEGIKKQLKDTLDSGFQKANVTLDPDTAHPQLILSEGWKSVKKGKIAQALPYRSERFDVCPAVLGPEGFTGGRHFWEVLVRSQTEWTVGVARNSVRRKEKFSFSPEEGFWAVGEKLSWAFGEDVTKLTGKLKRIRVCLNYTGGRVAFFDAEQAALLYEFSGASFAGETLLPFFCVNGDGQLRISSQDHFFTPRPPIRKYFFSRIPLFLSPVKASLGSQPPKP